MAADAVSKAMQCVCVCENTPYSLLCLSHYILLTSHKVGHAKGLPESVPEQYESNEEFLKAAHHVLMEARTPSTHSHISHSRTCTHTHFLLQVEVIEGELECPESGRRFPVEEGIPNMLLREDEV